MLKYAMEFHNLGGESIGEHQRNFRKFLTHISNLTDRVEIINSITPRNHQEAIFKIKLLAHLQQHEMLLDIFVLCNTVLNKIIIKDVKFIEYVASFGAKYFVDTLCPKISHVAKLQLIHKLGIQLNDGDEYFKLINKKYGIRLAYKLLPFCSEGLIRDSLQNYRIKFHDRQLIHIHKKHPDILHFYFQTGYDKFNKRHMLVDYLVNNDIKSMPNLVKFGLPNFGRKGVLKFLEVDKNYILKNSTKFQKHYIRIVRNLSQVDFIEYFKSLFPKDFNDLNDDCFMVIIKNLILLPIAQRLKTLDYTFLELYGFEYKYFNKDLLECLSIEDRMKFTIGENLELYPIDQALELIKNKLDLTENVHMRCDLVEKLVETCRINGSKESLLEVLRYFRERHGNDSLEIRLTFISRLFFNFNLIQLGDEYWRYINEILLTFDTNKEQFHLTEDFTTTTIIRKMNLGLDYNEDLSKYTKHVATYGYCRVFNGNNPKEERICLLKYPKLSSLVATLPYATPFVKCMDAIHEFNRYHPKYKISYYQLAETLRIIFEEYKKAEDPFYINCTINNILRFIPEDCKEIALRNELMEEFLENERSDVSPELWSLILKHRPYLIAKHYKKILRGGEQFSRIYYEINKMHYTKIPEICKRGARKNIPHALWFLSFSSDFVDLEKEITPNDNYEIDVYESGIEFVVTTQTTILKTLKNRFMALEVVPILLKYLKGDYKRYAIKSMHKIFYTLPEEKLLHYLQIASNRNELANQHCMYLGRMLLDYQDSVKIFKNTSNSELLKICLFKNTFYCYCNNPQANLLKLLKAKLQDLKDPEKEKKHFLKLNFIPKNVLIVYIIEFWDYMKRFVHIFNDLSSDVISRIPENLCIDILIIILFKKESIQFVYNFIKSSHHNAVRSLHEAIEKSVTDKKINLTTLLYEELCVKLLQEKNRNNAIQVSADLLKFLDYSCFSCFEIELILRITSVYLDSGFEGLAKYIVAQQREVIEEFGLIIIIHHSKIVSGCLDRICATLESDKAENTFNFIEHLLNFSDLTHIRLLAIQLLPRTKTRNVQYIQYYERLMDRILEDTSETIRRFLNYKLSS